MRQNHCSPRIAVAYCEQCLFYFVCLCKSLINLNLNLDLCVLVLVNGVRRTFSAKVGARAKSERRGEARGKEGIKHKQR